MTIGSQVYRLQDSWIIGDVKEVFSHLGSEPKDEPLSETDLVYNKNLRQVIGGFLINIAPAWFSIDIPALIAGTFNISKEAANFAFGESLFPASEKQQSDMYDAWCLYKLENFNPNYKREYLKLED